MTEIEFFAWADEIVKMLNIGNARSVRSQTDARTVHISDGHMLASLTLNSEGRIILALPSRDNSLRELVPGINDGKAGIEHAAHLIKQHFLADTAAEKFTDHRY